MPMKTVADLPDGAMLKCELKGNRKIQFLFLMEIMTLGTTLEH